MWDATVKSGKRLDAFDQSGAFDTFCKFPSPHATNQVVRTRSAQPLAIPRRSRPGV